MFRKADENDRGRLLEYLRREPEFNLFIIGDVLTLGFSHKDVEYFLQEKNGACEAVLMRYRDSLIVYTYDTSANLDGVVRRMDAYMNAGEKWLAQGKSGVIEQIMPLLARSPKTEFAQFFCVCRSLRADVQVEHLPLVNIARPDDTEDVGRLLLTIEEFGRDDYSSLRADVEQGTSTISFIRDPASGQVVATATCVAESDGAAMIIAVATLPSHRGNGYASACVYRLVDDLAKRGKSACLFFRNEGAGRIYRRLGFEDLGLWKALRYEANA